MVGGEVGEMINGRMNVYETWVYCVIEVASDRAEVGYVYSPLY